MDGDNGETQIDGWLIYEINETEAGIFGLAEGFYYGIKEDANGFVHGKCSGLLVSFEPEKEISKGSLEILKENLNILKSRLEDKELVWNIVINPTLPQTGNNVLGGLVEECIEEVEKLSQIELTEVIDETT